MSVAPALSRRFFLSGSLAVLGAARTGLPPLPPTPKTFALHVHPEGANGAFRTIQAALDAALQTRLAPADRLMIYVANGTHALPLILADPVKA